jgi:hypothetical protein
VISDGQGRYRVSGLTPGNYNVSAELTGFKTEIIRALTLTVGQELTLDFTLKVGEVVENITVVSGSSLLELTNGRLSAVVDDKKIRDLPLNARSFIQLSFLQPGVVEFKFERGVITQGRGPKMIVSGLRPTSNSFLLDGTYMNDAQGRTPGSAAGVFLGIDTVYLLDKLLAKAGLTNDEVEIVQIPTEVLLDAMETGSIDAAVVTEPMLTRLVNAGHAVVWGPAWGVEAGFQRSIISFGPTLPDDTPDAGRRFMVTYLKAVRQFNQGKTERNLDIMAKHTKYDRELLKKMCWPPFREDGQINIQSVLDYQDWAVKKGLLDRRLRADEFWEPSFIEYANQALNTPAQSGAAK